MLERRAVSEFRADGRVLSGTAVTYGELANVYGTLERFEPASFADLSDVRLDVQHDRRRLLTRTGSGLVLTDGESALTFRAELPITREADDTLELVRKQILRGASVEFIATSERVEDRTRVIGGAELLAVSIVDNPAYRSSRVEARRGRTGMRGGYRYGSVHTVANKGKVRKVAVRKGAFDYALDEGREVSLNFGSNLDSTLGTTGSGTLAVTRAADGLRASVTRLPDTAAASDLVALNAAGIPLYLRPRYTTDGIADAFEDVPEAGNPEVSVRNVKNALLLGFDLTVRGAGNGYDPVELVSGGAGRRRFYA